MMIYERTKTVKIGKADVEVTATFKRVIEKSEFWGMAAFEEQGDFVDGTLKVFNGCDDITDLLNQRAIEQIEHEFFA